MSILQANLKIVTPFLVSSLLRIGSDHDWISGIVRAMNGDAVAVVVVVGWVDLHVPGVDDIRDV